MKIIKRGNFTILGILSGNTWKDTYDVAAMLCTKISNFPVLIAPPTIINPFPPPFNTVF